jgi:hypothetical protein
MAVFAAPPSGSLNDADLAALSRGSPSTDETAALPRGSQSTNELAALTANSIGGNGQRREERDEVALPLVERPPNSTTRAKWRRWGSDGITRTIQRSDGHKAETRKDKLASVHFLAFGIILSL